MSLKMFSNPMELQALYTLCDKSKPEVAGELFSNLKLSFFRTEDHREVFSYLTDYAKDSSNNGFPSWTDLLVDTKLSKDIRKKLKLARNLEPTSNPKYLAHRLGAMAYAREFALALEDVSAGISDGDETTDPKEFVEKAQKTLAAINSSMIDIDESITSIGTDSAKTKELLEQILSPDSQPYIPTGFHAFDSMNRGLNRGALAIFAGTSGTGKSLLAGQMVRNMSLAGFRVCMVGLEMTEMELMQRELARQTQVDLKTVIDTENMTVPMRKELIKSYDKLNNTLKKKGGCIDYFSPDDDLTIEEILYSLAPKDYDAIFIDYIGLLGGLDGNDQWKAMKNATRFGKIFARNNNIVLCLLAQLTDDGSLRQSKGMKDDANNMWTWRMGEQERADGLMKIKQEKNRNGPMDPFDLHVDWSSMTVTDEGKDGNDEAVYHIGHEDSSETATWATSGIDFSRIANPMHQVHDLHDMNYWNDPTKGLCKEWEAMNQYGYVDNTRLYGNGFEYSRKDDENKVGNYIVPDNLRGDDYPADSLGRPLYDKNEFTYLTPKERQAMGFTGISIEEREALEAEKSTEFDDTPDQDFADGEYSTRDSGDDIEDPEDDEPVRETGKSAILNKPTSPFEYDTENELVHVSPSVAHVKEPYPEQGEEEDDFDYALRMEEYDNKPLATVYYEDRLGTYKLYKSLADAGKLLDKPNHMVSNWSSIPDEVKERLKAKKRPSTMSDIGAIPYDMLKNFLYSYDHEDRFKEPVYDTNPAAFPSTLMYRDAYQEGEITINSADEMRYLWGIKWFDNEVMALAEKLGWTPEFVTPKDGMVCPEFIGHGDGTPPDDDPTGTDDEPEIEESEDDEDVDDSADEGEAISPDDEAEYNSESEKQEGIAAKEIAPRKKKRSIFHFLHEYRCNPDAPGYLSPKKEYGDSLADVDKETLALWRQQWKADTIGDLQPDPMFPLSRYLLNDTGQSIKHRTPIDFPMVLTDAKTSETETVKDKTELRALFNIRFLIE